MIFRVFASGHSVACLATGYCHLGFLLLGNVKLTLTHMRDPLSWFAPPFGASFQREGWKSPPSGFGSVSSSWTLEHCRTQNWLEIENAAVFCLRLRPSLTPNFVSVGKTQ